MNFDMTDVEFGGASTVRVFDVSPDATGPAVATLVRVPAESNTRGAALLVHGFADYIFPHDLTTHLSQEGFDVYGLDMRGYGRSLRSHQLPNYVTDLATHFEELDAAARIIREQDGHDRLAVFGHSTGGLVTALWAHARRANPPLDALVLNSPWLDLAEPWFNRTVAIRGVSALAALAPRTVIRARMDAVYGHSIHRDHHGEWEFNLDWKPLAAFPVRAGWLAAIHRGHAEVQRGLDIPVSVLVLHSDRSLLHTREWTPDAMAADTVLDVAQIARWSPGLGRRVQVVPVPGALHDVFLSPPAVRAEALRATDGWLAETMSPERQGDLLDE